VYVGLHIKYPSFLSHFNGTYIFSSDFQKNIQISNLMKIGSVDAEFSQADVKI